MASPQVIARRKAEAREATADIVEKLGAEHSELVQRVKTYRDAGVLTGNRSEDALDTLVAALAEIVADLEVGSQEEGFVGVDAQDVAGGLDRVADRWHARERILKTASALEERYALDPMLLDRLEEKRGLKGKDTLAERFLRSAQRLRAVYRGEPLSPEHPDGDAFDVASMQHRGTQRVERAKNGQLYI